MDKMFVRSTDFKTLTEPVQKRVKLAIDYGYAQASWGWWNDRTYNQLKRIPVILKEGAEAIWWVMHPGKAKDTHNKKKLIFICPECGCKSLLMQSRHGTIVFRISNVKKEAGKLTSSYSYEECKSKPDETVYFYCDICKVNLGATLDEVAAKGSFK